MFYFVDVYYVMGVIHSNYVLLVQIEKTLV